MGDSLRGYREPIFFVSGFAGLIYESVWTQYLKLFLGHAAYAQTLVLAMFMGGMAIGSILTARYTAHIARPLFAYALVEASVGLLALLFHPVYIAATEGFYSLAFAGHWDGNGFMLGKWSLAAILILPQSILLGATFPLYASAATRALPTQEGRSIATLYFANSIGGAAGVLTAGFVLIAAFGLFGTVATAGLLNFAVAATVILLIRGAPAAATTARAETVPAASASVGSNKSASERNAGNRRARAEAQRNKAAAVRRRVTTSAHEAQENAAAAAKPSAAAVSAATSAASLGVAPQLAVRVLLAVSLLTGASSFIYEIGWIRMLSLVLGSATHSFELMLSAFVLGLALGGLWIRRRIDRAANPGVMLGVIQCAMGFAALATVPLHNASFDLFAWAMGVLPKTESGYALFNLIRYGIASLIMFPAAFFAGMTLPLATRLLYSTASQGERAIGMIYGSNTVGSIIGLLFAVHIGLPVLGLEYLVASGAVIDVLLGAVLLLVFGSPSRRRYAYAAVLLSLAASFAVAQSFNPQKLASGVFRTGKAYATGSVLEVAHGKTATITVERDGEFVAIKTNGKTDASANVLATGHFAPDQLTMTMAALVPLLIHNDPRQVANIGFGSGLTGDFILADPRIRHLDTIEIEPRMVDLARRFDPLNRSVYTDPRSSVRIDDAKSFFAANGQTYDVIVSEPSNPWVSGVAGLFSVEFYRQVSRYLNPDGLFAQWLQTYETHPDRIASVLKAMDEAFDDYMIVAIDEADILLVGKPHGKVTMPMNAFAKLSPAMKERLNRLDIHNQSDVTFRIVGNKALFHPWLTAQAVAANSDYVPYLDVNADRDRFFDRVWPDFIGVALSSYPIAELLGGRPPLPTPSALTITRQFGPEPLWLAARMVFESVFGNLQGPDIAPIPGNLPPDLANQGAFVIGECAHPPPGDDGLAAGRFGARILPYLSPPEGIGLVAAFHDAACLRIDPAAPASWPQLLRAVAARDGKAFGQIADDMLHAGAGATRARARYLLGMAMLGRIEAQQPERALALWSQYAKTALGGNPPDLEFNLLRARAAAAVKSQ